MRLEKIKLAGFKSFVDPTSVIMPSNLVGIVGPNGCGKSNVIDAVRWVMGESSAKMLRGESMADVIFNGSSARKPVGTATIELLFDNTDGSAGGEYAQYNQISVKRQVSRDGQSSYFLNNVRCRRRDITDLFLGTGLGPRSYAIIEQGMVTRLIEARPEDLRVFLEEAAGISKYKERRRETENRIRHTRENLERLNDLREEVAKQLQHLQRQAAVAEKYQQLKIEERRLQAELLALRWRALDAEVKTQDKAIATKETDLEGLVALQRRAEAEIERERERHDQVGEQFNAVQARYYALGAEVARLEQAIQYAKSARGQQQQDLEQLEQASQEAVSLKQDDATKLAQLLESLANEQPRFDQIRAAEEVAQDHLTEAERAMQAWQEEWDGFNQQATVPAQTAQVERTRINHLEQQQQELGHRSQRLVEETQRLHDPRLIQEIEELSDLELNAQEEMRMLDDGLQEILASIQSVRGGIATQAKEVDRNRVALQSANGRKASLEALQQAALGKNPGDAVGEWLQARGLSEASRVAEHLEVEAEWRAAVEVVLGPHLQAVCTTDLERFSDGFQTLEKGALTLFDPAMEKSPVVESDEEDAQKLLAYVETPLALEGILDDVYCAESTDHALALRGRLDKHASVVTADGLWMGPNWMRINRGEEANSGVLARAQELKRLESMIQEHEELAERLDSELDQRGTQLQELEQRREEAQSHSNEMNRKLSEIRSTLSSKQTRAEHLKQRVENIEKEQGEIQQRTEKAKDDLEQARTLLHKALEDMETLGERREVLIMQRDELRERLNLVREEHNRLRNDAHQVELQVQSLRSAQASLQQSLTRLDGQIAQINARRDEVTDKLTSGLEPIAKQESELQLKLDQRIKVEEELAEVRRSLEAVDKSLREQDQARNEAEQKAQSFRTELDKTRMQRQEVLVRAKTVEERLRESDFTPNELFAAMPDDAGEEQWQEQVERVAARIQRLGPINLAAIDEFSEQSERMQYLDSQFADVSESLETLEGAIRKIDRETRTRFKETFDRVNSGLQDLFPKLFDGGHSYLELTGEDLLDTGVAVMARPPGKRNTNIHLLSGGEKALTAVALVFAIFKLNPAPFCMLDEVDAPLDDANVGRFCKLVKSMSEQIQFIFITHNKVTMEVAEHLTGVTMHEPGVSRLVSVDVDEAARMAAL